jgi:uncharacterized integral membrane protein
MTEPAPDVPSEPAPETATPTAPVRGVTRVSAAWVATGVGLLLLILLLVFILQNLQRVQLHYLGLSGTMPLGVALFAASIAGGVVVAIAGASRIVQLRRAHRRTTT